MLRYRFESLGSDAFELYEDGVFLLRFTRFSFRSDFETFTVNSLEPLYSSNWIGSILRLFLKKFPSPFPVSKRNDSDRLIVRYGEFAMVEYLRSKGFHVVKEIVVSVKELIEALESRGYIIEGLINDCYYNSTCKNNRARSLPDLPLISEV